MCWILPAEPSLIDPSYWRDTVAEDDAADERYLVERDLDASLDAVRAAYPEPLVRGVVRDWVCDGWPAYNVEHPRDYWDGDLSAADWGAFFLALDDARLAFEEYANLEDRYS